MFYDYDSVIGLGGNCEVAHHTRRMGQDSANVFDWWIAPFGSVVSLLENRFDGLFEPENMEVIGDRVAISAAATASSIITISPATMPVW